MTVTQPQPTTSLDHTFKKDERKNILKDLYFRHTLLASTVLTVVVIFIFFGPLKFGKKKQKTALRVLVSGD
jgi:hypothetical protein